MITRCNVLCIHTVDLFLIALNWQTLVRCLQELLKNHANMQARPAHREDSRRDYLDRSPFLDSGVFPEECAASLLL